MDVESLRDMQGRCLVYREGEGGIFLGKESHLLL